MAQLEAVLFDMDGTLVETESPWKQAEYQTMTAYGSTWSEQEQEDALGGPFDQVVEYMAQEADADADQIAATLIDTIDELMRSQVLEIQPGIADAFQAAGSQQILQQRGDVHIGQRLADMHARLWAKMQLHAAEQGAAIQVGHERLQQQAVVAGIEAQLYPLQAQSPQTQIAHPQRAVGAPAL